LSPPSQAAFGTPERANILIVDDLQEKLLVFKTVLEELQQNLVFVRSGAEALREVLVREFAVILLDVNMPDIDGFETAALIRRYRRSAHTPIIFVTAYADELQSSRGYSLGAVDFIQSPVVPVILRSKVRVFVELHVLQRRIARRADERVTLAASSAALEAAEESTRRAAYLSELSAALSGQIEVRASLCRLLELVVPRLATGATVVALDSQRQPRYISRHPGAGGTPVERRLDELDPRVDKRLLQALQTASGPAEAAAAPFETIPEVLPHTYWLCHAGRTLGLIQIDGEPTPLGLVLLGEVASRAAIALATANLYDNLQDEIRERRQAEARLEQASRRKDEFLAMLSHELRNPLAPIRNAVEVIRRIADNDPQLVRATDITERQVRQLARLVDELLDVARISQGKIVLHAAPVDLTAVVAECVETQRPFAEARRQLLLQSLPPVAVWVDGDAARLQQVVNNLLNNACKYTPDKGRLQVSLVIEQGHAVLRVRDNGMGIDPELLPRVFDLFEQGARSLDRSQGGLGVGLTLVQRLVHLHRGEVEAISEGVEQGAEFVVRLPCIRHPAGALRGELQQDAQPSGCRRVLLVEDNADVAESTAMMLGVAGHSVRVVSDGTRALSEVAQFEPEVILLDIGLPGMDGYELARRLRQMPQVRGMLLVAVTGYGQAADQARGAEAGFDHHLLKPVDPGALIALIAAWTPAAGNSTTAQLYAFRRS
jgi:signal transduction histidine kinase